MWDSRWRIWFEKRMLWEDSIFITKGCIMRSSLIMNVSNSFPRDSLSSYTAWKDTIYDYMYVLKDLPWICPTLDKKIKRILFPIVQFYLMLYFSFVTFFPISFASVLVTVLNNKTTDEPVILPTKWFMLDYMWPLSLPVGLWMPNYTPYVGYIMDGKYLGIFFLIICAHLWNINVVLFRILMLKMVLVEYLV